MYLGLSRIANYFYFFIPQMWKPKLQCIHSDLFSFLHTELIQSQTNKKSAKNIKLTNLPVPHGST